MFLDIGFGIIGALLVSHWFAVALSHTVLGLGILFALLPDSDYLAYLAQRGNPKFAHRHRDLLHKPLPFLVLGTFIAYFVGGAFTATLFAVAVSLHFLHDSVGIGWGVRWLWPFSPRSYKFFSEPDGRVWSRRLLVSWSPDELNAAAERFGEGDWFRKYYLRFHPVGLIELVGFAGALVALYFFLRP